MGESFSLLLLQSSTTHPPTYLKMVGAVPLMKGRIPPSRHIRRAVREKEASSWPQVWYLIALAGLSAMPFKAPVDRVGRRMSGWIGVCMDEGLNE